MRGWAFIRTSLFQTQNWRLATWVLFIFYHFSVDKLFPDNWSTEDESPVWDQITLALIMKPRLILVVHTDNLDLCITSNQQCQMLVQNLNMIVCRPNVMPMQFLYCTTNCIIINFVLQEHFPTNTRVGNRLWHRNDRRQRSVIRVTFRNISWRSIIQPSACVWPATMAISDCRTHH